MAFSNKEKIENFSKIKKIATQRGIKQLVHFTALDHLPEMLSEGLYSRTILRKEKPGDYIYIDEVRNDKKLRWISVSVSFPNWKMFYNQRMNRKDLDVWVLLILDVKILWELDCMFMTKNAASSSLLKGSWASSWEFFNQMFEDENRAPLIPENWTSNPQAEVMVKDRIPANYIKKIVVENKEAKKACKRKCKTNLEIIINRKLFGPRGDYKFNR